MKKSPKYYWLIGLVTLLGVAVGYSLMDAIKEPTPIEVESSKLVDSRMAIIDKNATARSMIKNMLTHKSTKITVISGTGLAMSDYVLGYNTLRGTRGYLDLTHLTPAAEGSYVLWSKSPTEEYTKVKVFPPNREFLPFGVPPKDHTMFITLESAGAGNLPDLTSIIAVEQVEN